MPRKRYDTPHRSRVVKTRMTEEEYADFAARLAPYGISQSEFIRRAIQGASIRPVVTVSPVNDELLAALGKLTSEYGRIGNNLNQIARAINDWQTALVPVYYNLMFASRPFYENIKTVFTIHNIQYQGRYGREILEYVLGIDDAHFRSGFMAMDGDVNLMKAAIVASTAVTTVSPTYANEIQTEYYGYRLDSVLRMNSYKLHGILNGINMDAFNPETDSKIFKNYGPNNPQDKLVNKTELLKLCGLEGDANTPVIGIVTRFVDQKGLDLVEAVLPDILADDVRLIVLGTGDYRYEQMFIEAKRRWPDKVSASIMFSGDLANRIYAGADMFLMPSKFEPCGLAQMIALRYGTIPIVRETGGLKDTVHAFVDYAGTGNGFTFASYNAHDMLHVIREACGVFRFNKPAWSKLIMQGMQSDFSWGSSADKYIEVYKTAMGQ